MGKKSAEIRKLVDNSGVEFYEYLRQTENEFVISFIERANELTKVFIFSGVIRNFFLRIKNNRDIDLILEKEVNFEKFLPKAEIKKNSFGGYKILFNQTIIDLWYLEHTWAFKNDHFEVLQFGLEQKIPDTAFFNFSSIVYSVDDKRFYYNDHFIEFLKDQEIDYVYDKNPNYKLCVVNSFYYSEKYKLNISNNLKEYIVKLYKEHDKDYTEIQLKHFGKVLYPNDQLEHRIETIFLPRKKNFKKKNIIEIFKEIKSKT